MIPESYLSHALGEQRANHRYIARVPIGNNRNRYFYTIDEYRAFRNGGSRKSLGDRLDAARSKAAKNASNVSKTIANRNQAVRKKAEDATWNALSRINKGLSGRSTPKTTGDKSHSTKIFRDYIDTMTDPKKRSQQLQNEKDRNRRMTEQGVVGEMKRGYNGIVDDIKSTKDKAVSSVKRDYEGMKKDVDTAKKAVSDIKSDIDKSIRRPIDAGVDKNSAMKKQVDAMKKANLAMNLQTKYKGGYNIKPLTNLDVISTTAAKGAANVANRVSAQAATKTKEHMAEAKKQVDEGVKRSENYWSKKKDAEKDAADLVEKVKSTADKGKDFINDMFDKAKDKASDVIDDTKKKVSSAGGDAKKTVNKFTDLAADVAKSAVKDAENKVKNATRSKYDKDPHLVDHDEPIDFSKQDDINRLMTELNAQDVAKRKARHEMDKRDKEVVRRTNDAIADISTFPFEQDPKESFNYLATAYNGGSDWSKSDIDEALWVMSKAIAQGDISVDKATLAKYQKLCKAQGIPMRWDVVPGTTGARIKK